MDQGATNFAAMTGPIVGAVLAAQFGIPVGLMAAGFIGLVGAALFVWTVVRRRRTAIAVGQIASARPTAAALDAEKEPLAEA